MFRLFSCLTSNAFSRVDGCALISRSGLASLLVVTLLLQSCVTYEAKPLDTTQSLASVEGRTLNDSGLQEFLSAHGSEIGAHAGKWGLPELTLAALYFHPDLAAARAEQNAAEASLKQAEERPNPSVNLSPGYNATSTGISPWILTTALDFPLELHGKRSLRRKGAEQSVEASRWRLAETGWQTRQHLRESMLTLYAAERTRDLLVDQETLQAEIAALLEGKRKAGESSAFEASLARLGLSQTRLALHETERRAAVARVRLAEAVGVSSAALDAVRLDFTAFEKRDTQLDQAEARRRALSNRADILAALADYAATEQSLQLEIANQYPDINLGPGYELDQTDNKWSLGLTLELPLLNQNRGKIAEAIAARELAAAKFQQVQMAALAEIDAAVVNLKGARKTTQTARKILDEVEHEAETTRKMKDAGALERAELLQRDLEVSASQLALIDAEISEQEAVGLLENALQTPATALPASF